MHSLVFSQLADCSGQHFFPSCYFPFPIFLPVSSFVFSSLPLVHLLCPLFLPPPSKRTSFASFPSPKFLCFFVPLCMIFSRLLASPPLFPTFPHLPSPFLSPPSFSGLHSPLIFPPVLLSCFFCLFSIFILLPHASLSVFLPTPSSPFQAVCFPVLPYRFLFLFLAFIHMPLPPCLLLCSPSVFMLAVLAYSAGSTPAMPIILTDEKEREKEYGDEGYGRRRRKLDDPCVRTRETHVWADGGEE